MYKDIVLANERFAPVKWWPHYAYHYTDISNAVNILETGMLYSRSRAEKLGVMYNDNASQQVISNTSQKTTSYVRFYFRPLTPTQFYNEGYKHCDLRFNGDVKANVPVPVFFFFDLNQLLSDPKTLFSEGSEAGAGSPVLKGEERFSDLNFKMIYKYGPYIYQNPGDKKREGSIRQSEILYPDCYRIDRGFIGIICRNAVERTTLLNLLMNRSQELFDYYQPKIRIFNNRFIFYNNGLYIEECSLHQNDFSITFSDAYPRRQYAIRYSRNNKQDNLRIVVRIQLLWLDGNKILYQKEEEVSVNYLNAMPIVFNNVPEIDGAQKLSVKIYFEKHLMCYCKFLLRNAEY